MIYWRRFDIASNLRTAWLGISARRALEAVDFYNFSGSHDVIPTQDVEYEINDVLYSNLHDSSQLSEALWQWVCWEDLQK